MYFYSIWTIVTVDNSGVSRVFMNPFKGENLQIFQIVAAMLESLVEKRSIILLKQEQV